MRTLIVSLPEDPAAPAAWALFTGPEAARLREGTLASEAALPADILPERTWVLVPGAAVTTHMVDLPADVRERHALAGAAFALEDNLAVDADLLHFALGAAVGPKRLVAVTDQTLMTAWIARLASHGLKADLLIPDYLALPEGVVTCEGRVFVRNGDGGFATEADLTPWLLTSGEDIAPLSTQAFLLRAYATLAQGPVLTLLQGRYAPRRDWGPLLRPWKRAGALAAGVVIAGLISVAVDGARLNSQAEAAAAQAEAVFRAALPEVKRVVNPRAQMRAHLQTANLSASGGFIAVSDVIVSAVAAVEGSELNALRFDGKRGEASATLALPNFDAVELLKAEMTKKGAVVQEGGARQDGARIITDITVRLP